MGLDITAYKTVRFVRENDDESESETASLITLYLNEDFPERADGLKDGYYETSATEADAMGFRAGSYSGYSQWRNWLCQATLGVDDDTVYADRARFKGKPFYELINFSDCEGTIGPKTSAKLAADFAANREAAVAFASSLPSEDGQWFVQQYDRWAAAFALAAGGGAVCFR